MSPASRRSVFAVLASCVVHGAIVLAMHRPGRASERISSQPLSLELRFEQRETVPAPVDEEPHASAPVQHAALARRGRPAAQRHAFVSPVPEPIEVASQPSPTANTHDTAQEPSEQTPDGQRAPTLDLSPLAAARSLGDSRYFPLRDAGVPARDDSMLSHTAQANALAQQVPHLRASTGSDRTAKGVIIDVAEDLIYNVLRPWQLFRRSMLGSQYRYTGAGFDAAILPDGRVRFRDKDGPMFVVTSTKSRESGASATVAPAPTVGLSLGDPRALWFRIRGKDPFAAERRLFLERTRALRDYLAGRSAASGMPAVEESVNVEQVEPRLEPPAQR